MDGKNQNSSKQDFTMYDAFNLFRNRIGKDGSISYDGDIFDDIPGLEDYEYNKNTVEYLARKAKLFEDLAAQSQDAANAITTARDIIDSVLNMLPVFDDLMHGLETVRDSGATSEKKVELYELFHKSLDKIETSVFNVVQYEAAYIPIMVTGDRILRKEELENERERDIMMKQQQEGGRE